MVGHTHPYRPTAGAEVTTADGWSLPLSAKLSGTAQGGIARLVLEQRFENRYAETRCEIEAALDPEGLSTTARAVLARITGRRSRAIAWYQRSMRIDRVYTRGGDQGETSLIGGERVSKASPRLEGYGTVDELNATLGLVGEALAASAAGPHLLPILRRVQNELFNLGAELATADPATRARLPRIEQRHIDGLERDIDAVNDDLPALRSFVLPGGGWASAYFHLARTVCRRCERIVVALAQAEDVGELAVSYLNRLSDALFVWGRWCAVKDGRDEPLWDSRST